VATPWGAGPGSIWLAVGVLKWSRARRRYERQGLLVEEAALDRAEAECLADGEARARRREREPAILQSVKELRAQFAGA
jgi:hypothetical protein